MTSAANDRAVPFVAGMPEGVDVEPVLWNLLPSAAALQEHLEKVIWRRGIAWESAAHSNNGYVAALHFRRSHFESWVESLSCSLYGTMLFSPLE
jgi:hypothetical protein